MTPWAAAHQAFLFFTISRSLLKLMSIESRMPPNHLILYCPLILLPSIFPSIRVFSNESALCIRWPKYCSFSLAVQTWAKGSSLPGWMGRFQGQSQVFSSTGEAIIPTGIAGEGGCSPLRSHSVTLQVHDPNCSLPPAGDEYLGCRQAGRFGVGEGGAENVQL